MFLVSVIFLIVMGVAIGWSIGANDAANSLGTAVGSKVLTLRQAIILIAVFGLLGAVLQGSSVTKTLGKGIVNLALLDKQVALYLAILATFAASLWVVIATYWKMPISTSHSIVGAIAGGGLAVGAAVKWKLLLDIFICWILTPVGAALIAFVFYLFFRWLFPRILPLKYERPVTSVLIIISGCYVAFSWGANDVANATGLINGAGVLPVWLCVLIGGLAIVLGIVTWGYKVIETIGSNITHLLPLMAFSAQLASAVNVHVYTLMGIPVSTSHSIVGAIVGVGLVRGIKVINMRIFKDIVFCWIATPFISGVLCFGLMKFFMFFMPFIRPAS